MHNIQLHLISTISFIFRILLQVTMFPIVDTYVLMYIVRRIFLLSMWVI